ncbi:methyltransferase domain-containing protein [Candidatus Aerophobetes bacterium]|nr:methyltransferase domain-containing protein [Candidatus Aerophobetes bacterium]
MSFNPNFWENEKIAQNYDKWYERGKGKYADNMEKDLFLKLINPYKGQTLLEIGSGTGHFSFWFHSLRLKVVGVDSSSAMLRVAKEKTKDNKINFIKAEAEELPFSSRSFDLVALVATLEFVNSPEKILKEAFRVAKKKIFLGVLAKWSFLAFKRKIKALFKSSVYKEAKFYSVKELIKLVKRYAPEKAKIQYKKTLKGAFIGLAVNLK